MFFFLIVIVSTNHHLKVTCAKSSLDCVSRRSGLENTAAQGGLWSQVSLPLPLQILQIHVQVCISYI